MIQRVHSMYLPRTQKQGLGKPLYIRVYPLYPLYPRSIAVPIFPIEQGYAQGEHRGSSTAAGYLPSSLHGESGGYRRVQAGTLGTDLLVFERPSRIGNVHHRPSRSDFWDLNAGYENAIHAAATLLHAHNQ